MKLPKGFPRRKSSGNALEDIQNSGDAASSFKVLTRPSSTEKAHDAGNNTPYNLAKPLPLPRGSFEDDSEHSFSVARDDAHNRYADGSSLIRHHMLITNSGSGGTSNSLSTTQYDSAASSTRLSVASTNPSSVDARSDKNVKAIGHRSYEDCF